LSVYVLAAIAEPPWPAPRAAQIMIPSDADQRIETPLHDAAVGTGNYPSLSLNQVWVLIWINTD